MCCIEKIGRIEVSIKYTTSWCIQSQNVSERGSVMEGILNWNAWNVILEREEKRRWGKGREGKRRQKWSSPRHESLFPPRKDEKFPFLVRQEMVQVTRQHHQRPSSARSVSSHYNIFLQFLFFLLSVSFLLAISFLPTNHARSVHKI